jgi:hypothetical protein
MSNRNSLSKKIRFEVFKRDSFKCQYCGKSAPNVILEVDHINPVSKGGDNDLLNLITSCYDCNRGKSDRQIDDDSVILKQRQQLELLQERREQIELMFNWRKELDNLSSDIDEMIVNYIENKMEPSKLNESGSKKIKVFARKHNLADILEAVDLSAEKYLSYDNKGNLVHSSVEEFIDKIGGIIVNKNKPPIEIKCSYIKGICRNRFNYWNPQQGSIILNNYVKALRQHGWSEELILEDLDQEVIPKTKEVKNWTEWRQLMEKWTEDIKGWKSDNTLKLSYPINTKELDECVHCLIQTREHIIPALNHIGSGFPRYEPKDLPSYLDMWLTFYLKDLSKFYSKESNDTNKKPFYVETFYGSFIISLFYNPDNDKVIHYLQVAVISILFELIDIIEKYTFQNSEPQNITYINDRYCFLLYGMSFDEFVNPDSW